MTTPFAVDGHLAKHPMIGMELKIDGKTIPYNSIDFDEKSWSMIMVVDTIGKDHHFGKYECRYCGNRYVGDRCDGCGARRE